METNCGYYLDLFLTPPNDRLLCPLCLEVLINPTGCQNGHIFCRKCILAALAVRSECPSCRINLTVSNLSVNLIAKEMVGELKLRCPTTLYGKSNSTVSTGTICLWNGTMNDVDKHLAVCGNFLVNCQNIGCTDKIPRRLLPSHLSVCMHHLVRCSYCNHVVKRKDSSIHTMRCPRNPAVVRTKSALVVVGLLVLSVALLGFRRLR